MVVTSLKHNVKSPVTMDYHANSVVPTRQVVYRKVTGIYTLDSFGLAFGVIVLDGVDCSVVRRMQSNSQWSQWESIKLANYLN